MQFVAEPKDPSAVKDYRINWADWLGEDTITTSTWVADAGITLATQSHTGKVTIMWLSGGTAGIRYSVVNRIVTTGGRTEERTIIVPVENR